jgi:hypothetical protein
LYWIRAKEVRKMATRTFSIESWADLPAAQLGEVA